MGKCEPAAQIERVRVGNPPPKVARAALLPDGLVFGVQVECCFDFFCCLSPAYRLLVTLFRSTYQVRGAIGASQAEVGAKLSKGCSGPSATQPCGHITTCCSAAIGGVLRRFYTVVARRGRQDFCDAHAA